MILISEATQNPCICSCHCRVWLYENPMHDVWEVELRSGDVSDAEWLQV